MRYDNHFFSISFFAILIAIGFSIDHNGMHTVAGSFNLFYNSAEAAQVTSTVTTVKTWVRVTNLSNGKDIVVRINDRGPFVKGRIIDLSIHAATVLGIVQSGTAKVKLEALGSGHSASSAG